MFKSACSIIKKHIFSTITDLDGVIIDVSDGFAELSGYDREELIGKTHAVMRHHETPPHIYRELWDTIRGGKIWKGEIQNLTKENNSYWSNVTIEPLYNNNEPVGYIALRSNITEYKMLQKLASRDAVTEIFNRSKMDELLRLEIERATRYEQIFSLFFIDLDNFKTYNDDFGHLAGDRMLKLFARKMQQMIRSTDIFGRWGGDEFVMITPHTAMEEALQLAEKVRKNIFAYEFLPERKLSISVGIATFEPGDTADELLGKADTALYQAKYNGRNQVRLFESSRSGADPAWHSMYGLNVLYLENDKTMQNAIARYLKAYGINVITVGSTEEALDAFSHYNVDILLTDLQLAGNDDCLYFLKRIRKQRLTTPIIITTAHTDREFLLEAVELNITRYLVKPYLRSDLMKALEKASANLDSHHNTIRLTRHFSYDRQNHSLFLHNKFITLSKKEGLLLRLLCERPNSVISYDQIENYVWPDDVMSMDALRTLVRGIRKKTHNELIKTVIGVGYQIQSVYSTLRTL